MWHCDGHTVGLGCHRWKEKIIDRVGKIYPEKYQLFNPYKLYPLGATASCHLLHAKGVVFSIIRALVSVPYLQHIVYMFTNEQLSDARSTTFGRSFEDVLSSSSYIYIPQGQIISYKWADLRKGIYIINTMR